MEKIAAFVLLFVFIITTLFCVKAFSFIPLCDNCIFYDPLNSSEDMIIPNGGTQTGVSFTEGIIDNAAKINGAIRYPYNNPNVQNFDPNSGTVQFLVKPTDIGNMGLFESGLLGYANSIGIFRFTMYNRTITALELRKNNRSYLQAWHDKDAVRLESNDKWYLITAIWECNQGNVDFFQMYINDVPGYRHSGSSVGTDFLVPATKHIRLGATGWYGNGEGIYDELKIYDYAKTEAEIKQDYLNYFSCDNPPCNVCICGDADGSGAVDIFDALLVAKYDAGLINPDEVACFECCDVNNDGKVDIFDALLIAKFNAGIIPKLNCQKVNCQ